MNRHDRRTYKSFRRRGLEFKIGLEGWMRLEVYEAESGQKTKDTGWFKNLITNQGLDAIAQQADVMAWFHVGTNDNPPQITDTWVTAWRASSNDIRSTIDGVQGVAPFYGYKRRTIRFDVGTASGNLQECAVGWSATTGTAFSHELIRNTVGDAIEITVQANEWLDFTYELRYYPPVDDFTSTCLIDGIQYSFTVRALNVTSTFYWSQYIGNQFYEQDAFESYHRAYTGELAAVTASQPLGTDATGTTTVTVATYVPGQYYRTFTVSASTTQWNVAGGVIRSLVLSCRGNRWQARFAKVSDNTGIPKTSAIGLQMTWRVAWARAS